MESFTRKRSDDGFNERFNGVVDVFILMMTLLVQWMTDLAYSSVSFRRFCSA